jgi:dUTP pyrophosphatase
MDKLKVWKIYEEAVLPVRMTEGSVGYDICAAEDYYLSVGDLVYVRTGLVIQPPLGYHIEIALRSSIPKKKGIIIPHGLGIVDQDYIGENDEFSVPMYKVKEVAGDIITSNFPCACAAFIEVGERIAQIIVRKTHTPDLIDATNTPFSDKSRGGFGSTGNK